MFESAFMSLSLRTRRLSRSLLPLFLAGSLSLASAQNRAPQRLAPSPSPLPLLIGAAIGGIVVGGALGAGLKKKPAPLEIKEEPVFETAPAALAVVDSKERLVSANASWHALLGTGESPVPSFASLLHPDDLAPVRVALFTIFDGETASVERQARFFRPDGTLVTARLCARKQGDKSKPETILVGLHDASELVEVTRELNGARAAIRALYEVMAGDKSATLDDKMKSLLSMGCGRLELPIGALSRRVKATTGAKPLKRCSSNRPTAACARRLC